LRMLPSLDAFSIFLFSSFLLPCFFPLSRFIEMYIMTR
jgi:hypothetical protein